MTNSFVVKRSLLISGAVIFALALAGFLSQTILADVSATLLPRSDGAYSQWTPNSGSVHYARVDETACNGATDYNYTNTVGNRDSYDININSLPNGSTITDIEITPCASRNKKGGNGSATMNVFYRWSGILM